MNDEIRYEIRELYSEGFQIEVICRLLRVSLDTVLEAIWGKK